MKGTAARIGHIARVPEEHDTFRGERDNGSVEMGTVGWEGKPDHFDLGTEDNDGHTLVRVTLFRGRDISKEHTPDVGQGTRILARMGKPARSVPERGSTVIVARPAGYDVWHIISNPGPGTTFRNGPKAGDALFEGNAGNFVRFAQDGSISLVTTVDGTSQSPTIYRQIRRDGERFVGPWGKITFDAGGYHLKHHTGARIDLGGIGGMPAPLDVLGSYATIIADIVKLAGSVVALGPDVGVQDNVPLWTPLLAILSSIVSAISAVDDVANKAGLLAAAMTPSPPGAAATAAALALTASQLTATGVLGSLAISMAAAPSTTASKAVTVV